MAQSAQVNFKSGSVYSQLCLLSQPPILYLPLHRVRIASGLSDCSCVSALAAASGSGVARRWRCYSIRSEPNREKTEVNNRSASSNRLAILPKIVLIRRRPRRVRVRGRAITQGVQIVCHGGAATPAPHCKRRTKAGFPARFRNCRPIPSASAPSRRAGKGCRMEEMRDRQPRRTPVSSRPSTESLPVSQAELSYCCAIVLLNSGNASRSVGSCRSVRDGVRPLSSPGGAEASE